MTKQVIREEPLTLEKAIQKLASGISDVAAERKTLSIAEQWKIDLQTGVKTKMDLIDFLDQAPGKPVDGQPMNPDVPVPWYKPGPKQRAAHEMPVDHAGENGVHTKIVAGGWRAGKLLAPETPILTTAGWKSYSDIRLGDFVFGVDGEPTQVVDFSPDWHGLPCYRVRFSDGTFIDAAGPHEWVTVDRGAGGPTVKTTEEIRDTLDWNHAIARGDEVFYVTGVDSIDTFSGRCFTVAASDGLYLAGRNLIPTHNSKFLAAELLFYMFKEHARVWIVGPDYSLAVEEFNYIWQWLEWMGCPGPGGTALRVSDQQEGSKQIWTKWGAHLETKPAIKEKLEAAALSAVGIAEAGAVPKFIVDQVRSRVMERRGPVLISGRMEASELWYIEAVDRYQVPKDGWAAWTMPSWENVGMFPGGRQDPAIITMERTLPDEEFRRKVCAEIVKPKEIVFHEFDQAKHVVPIGWYDINDAVHDHLLEAYSIAPARLRAQPKATVDPVTGRVTKWMLPSTCEITLAIDPGWEHAYAVLALARFDDTVFVVDELYLQGTVAEDVIYECKQREWWPRVTAVGAGPTYSVIDVAANQHQGMKSHSEVWRENARLYLRTQKVPIFEGILRMRTFLERPGDKIPRLYIDPNCTGLIGEFSKYKYRLQKENRPIKEEPIDRDNHCFDDQTEILTERGWVRFPDLPRDVRVATRSADGELVYQFPTEYHEYAYSGEVVVGKGKQIDFVVTPNHRMFTASQYSIAKQRYVSARTGYVDKDSNPEFGFTLASELPATTWLSRTAKWAGAPVEPPVIIQRDRQVRPDMVAFARFLGLWLAEGCTSTNHRGNYYTHIDQKKFVNEVEEIIQALGVRYFKGPAVNATRFTIASRTLYEYLRPCGTSAWTKRIPREWLEGTPDILAALWEGYRLGDGSSSGYPWASSTSKGLLDDMQELAFKCGWASSVLRFPSHNENRKSSALVRLENIHPSWYISIQHGSEGGACAEHGLVMVDRDRHVSRQGYDGMVYCVTVPNGVIAVRRNGRVMWSGNSIKALTYWLVVNFDFVDRGHRNGKGSYNYLDGPPDNDFWAFQRSESDDF